MESIPQAARALHWSPNDLSSGSVASGRPGFQVDTGLWAQANSAWMRFGPPRFLRRLIGLGRIFYRGRRVITPNSDEVQDRRIRSQCWRTRTNQTFRSETGVRTYAVAGGLLAVGVAFTRFSTPVTATRVTRNRFGKTHVCSQLDFEAQHGGGPTGNACREIGVAALEQADPIDAGNWDSHEQSVRARTDPNRGDIDIRNGIGTGNLSALFEKSIVRDVEPTVNCPGSIGRVSTRTDRRRTCRIPR